MASELVVVAALANCGRDAPTEEFFAMLAEGAPELAVFRHQPVPRAGWGIKASIDWQAILGTGADLLAFAGVLWAAYEKYVKPKREAHNGSPAPFLFIQIKRPDGTFVQCGIGNEFQDKDVFIEHFVQEATELRAGAPDDPEGSVLNAISQHEDWIRIQVSTRKDAS